MNTTGCGFLFLAALALLAGLIPFLAWTNLAITLPLAVIGAFISVNQARKPVAQPADRALSWLALGLVVLVIARVAVM